MVTKISQLRTHILSLLSQDEERLWNHQHDESLRCHTRQLTFYDYQSSMKNIYELLRCHKKLLTLYNYQSKMENGHGIIIIMPLRCYNRQLTSYT